MSYQKDHILVRYSGIATKSEPVRGKMANILRQRVEDRLDYEGVDCGGVASRPGRIIVQNVEPAAAEHLVNTPGVASVSPAIKIDSEISDMKEAAEELEIGETFGVKTNRAGKHNFDSREINRKVGAYIEEVKGSSVDLDNPDTWVELDIRYGNTYVFTERFEGPDGFPVGAAGTFGAMISGGIDSPVAAYEMMKRGADIIPIYVYNKPIAAEDHFLRFKAVVEKLKRFNPDKKWIAYKIDFEEVNEELMEVERGRMILHRQLMFKAAEKIVENEGIEGIVTGESLSQKSSQTASNLKKTSEPTDVPVHRPLLTSNKQEIVAEARNLGTYDDAKIASACRTMAPDSPATKISEEDLEELKSKIGFEELAEKARNSVEEIEL